MFIVTDQGGSSGVTEEGITIGRDSINIKTGKKLRGDQSTEDQESENLLEIETIKLNEIKDNEISDLDVIIEGPAVEIAFKPPKNTPTESPGTEEIGTNSNKKPLQSTETSTTAASTMSQTSQPIIIIGNYSRTSYAYATYSPPVSTIQEVETSTPSAPAAEEDSELRRRHTLTRTGTPGHHFTITYWFFYPFNHGKEVCTTTVWLLGRVAKPLFKGKCLGQKIVIGNHVGDWEHVSIYFEVRIA